MTVRTTLMVGFPGETDQDFQELCDFIKEVKFDDMGAFMFSPQEGTPAARMADQIPEEVKESRYHELMSIQAGISEENNENLIGTETEVLVEELIDTGISRQKDVHLSRLRKLMEMCISISRMTFSPVIL